MRIFFERTGEKPVTGGSSHHYQADLNAVETDGGSPNYLRIQFVTDADQRRSSFVSHIGSAHFVDLALEMVRADPVAAIKAFASAMQTASIVRQVGDTPR